MEFTFSQIMHMIIGDFRTADPNNDCLMDLPVLTVIAQEYAMREANGEQLIATNGKRHYASYE